MTPAWVFALVRLAVAAGIAVVLGLLFGHVGRWLAAVLAGTLAWQFVNLFRVQRWLRHRSHEEPPELGGVWGDVVAQISRIYRRKLFHKRRVAQQFREFRRLSAALPDGVALLSGDLEILWFNKAAAQLLGLRRKVDAGIPISNLVRQPEFAAYLRKGAGGNGVVIPMHGGERFLALIVIPVAGQHLLLVRDVTREARLEEMRRDFVANASHELRSPLTVISGYLEQFGERPDLGDEWREPVAAMLRQTTRMREIVDDLLELSRLESTGDEAPLLPVDMPSLLDRLVRDASSSAPAALRIDLDADPGLWMQGSERELESIAANLLSNAIKYTPAEGAIAVRWRRGPSGPELAVKDTGIGIAAEHLPRLTERFYRVDRSRSRAKGGSGLGLAIVKHGLQRHGGRLEIASEEGRGSTFTAHFPARRAAARQETATQAS